MDPITAGALIGGGVSLIGGYLGQQGAAAANDANKDLNHENRNWQYSMSSTAHQRAVEDLKAAGLNPLLAAGAAASTPNGSVATMTNEMEGAEASAKGISEGLYRSIELKQALAKQNAEIGKINVDAKTSASQEKLNQSQARAADASAEASRVRALVDAKGIPEAEVKNEVYKWLKKKATALQNTSAKFGPPQMPSVDSHMQRIEKHRKKTGAHRYPLMDANERMP